MEAVMAADLQFDDIKKFIRSYAIHQHLYNMPPAVRRQFNGMMEAKNYNGSMKYWPEYLENTDQEPPQFPKLTNDSDYEKLYAMFQAAFENMSENRGDLVDKGKEDTTLAFLDKWYGPGKLFQASQPVSGLNTRLTHFANFLETHASRLNSKVLRYANGLPEKFNYNSFVSDLRDPSKYNDKDFRAALTAVASYVQDNSTDPSARSYGAWPTNVPEYDFTRDMGPNAPALNADTTKWFTHVYNPAFKHRLPELFNKLVSSGTVLTDFTTYDSSSTHPKRGAISSKIQEALDFTSYDKEGDNFVKPKEDDELNIWERFQKAKDDFVENHVDPWTDMLRGRRIFFSPYARTIVEACGKVKTKDGKKIKPSDGLQAFIDNKDAIAKKLAGKDPKGASHFDWFVKKLEEYSGTYEKAFKGALKNPRKMKKIVSAFIIDGIKDSKVAQVKTALEILSVMKYGVFTSKTMDELKKAEFTWLSDKGLSWNKYEGVQFVTSAFDKTLKYASLGIGRSVAAIRNKYFRDHTKFRGNTKRVKKAYDKWKKDNNKETFDENVRTELETDLRNARAERSRLRGLMMAAGGPAALRTDINNSTSRKTTLENRREKLQTSLAELQQQLATDPNIMTRLNGEIGNLDNQITLKDAEVDAARRAAGTPPTPTEQANIDNLEYELEALQSQRQERVKTRNRLSPAHISRLESYISDCDSQITNCDTEINDKQKLLDDNNRADNDVRGLIGQVREARTMSGDWDSGHGDNYMKLMAYWDMLETYGMSHRNPWFKSMKDVRDDYTRKGNMGRDDSQADIDIKAWTDAYLAKYR